MFEYFYHEILRKTIIGFGSLFNQIQIKHTNDSDQVVSTMQVPLAYGPTEKFLARLRQDADLNKPVQLSLPRMSFEFVGLDYDRSRKVTTAQSFLTAASSDKKKVRKSYMPVPYNMTFELSVYTKKNDDMLQIVEQILPYFQPQYNMTVNLVEEIGEKRDIPIVLEGISMNDDYEGDFTTRRSLIYTMRFTAKTYLFGPVVDVSKDVIEKVSIGYVAGDRTKTPSRDIVYSIEPKATKSYGNSIITTLSSNINDTETVITVDDASQISESSYIYIDEETIFVKSKRLNELVVERGSYSTTASSHVLGSGVALVTDQDNSLIEFGDDFGFSGSF